MPQTFHNMRLKEICNKTSGNESKSMYPFDKDEQKNSIELVKKVNDNEKNGREGIFRNTDTKSNNYSEALNSSFQPQDDSTANLRHWVPLYVIAAGTQQLLDFDIHKVSKYKPAPSSGKIYSVKNDYDVNIIRDTQNNLSGFEDDHKVKRLAPDDFSLNSNQNIQQCKPKKLETRSYETLIDCQRSIYRNIIISIKAVRRILNQYKLVKMFYVLFFVLILVSIIPKILIHLQKKDISTKFNVISGTKDYEKCSSSYYPIIRNFWHNSDAANSIEKNNALLHFWKIHAEIMKTRKICGSNIRRNIAEEIMTRAALKRIDKTSMKKVVKSPNTDQTVKTSIVILSSLMMISIILFKILGVRFISVV